MKIRVLFLFSFCLLLLGSCKKDSLVTTITEEQPPTPNVIIESTIQGLIMDRQGAPLAGASVSWGNAMIETDENGVFIIENLVNGEEAVLKVEKDGFFDAFQTILPIAGSTMKTRVQLTPRLLSTSFAAQQGGTLTLNNGSQVDFQANAFMDQAGNPYQGEVNIFATYIDPSDPEIAEIMPGNLLAINTENEQQTLQSFGMMNVELEANNGEQLQISAPATLRMAIPADRSMRAPGTLPLWYFDKATGFWKEEGSADLVNDEYVGEVAHFSFWNCDVPYDLVELTGAFSADKYELTGQVRVTATDLNTQGVVGLSADGAFKGKVIANTPLLLELIDPYCGDVLYSVNLGSLSDASNLGTINIELDSDWVSLSGTLVNCDQEAVSDGVAIIQLQGQSYIITANEDGSLLAAFRPCGASNLAVTGIDWEEQVRGSEQSYSVSPTLDVGEVKACGLAFTAQVKISIPGQADYIINNCTARLEPNDSIGNIYTLTSIDNQGDGNKVLYTYHFINWTNDINNPIWGMSTEYQIFGNPGKILIFGGDMNISAVQQGEQAGDALFFRVENARVTNEVTSEEYENGQVELSAIIE